MVNGFDYGIRDKRDISNGYGANGEKSMKTSEELRKDIERQKLELAALVEKENKTFPIIRETAKSMNIAFETAMFRLTEHGLSESDASQVLQNTVEKMGFGIQTVPEKKQTVKLRKAKTNRKTNFGPTQRAIIPMLGIPTPADCLQAVLVLLERHYDVDGRQAKAFSIACGKVETLSAAKSKFNNNDPTGKLWVKQSKLALPYVKKYGLLIKNYQFPK